MCNAALVLVCLAALVGRAAAAPDAVLLRLFLADGGTVVSYGAFARTGDQVVFSTPVGGTPEAPRLQVVSLPESAIDWARTDRYAIAARAGHYAATRGPADFQALEADVAEVLDGIAGAADPQRARQAARQVRTMLAAWPGAHFDYRADDVRALMSRLDAAIGLSVSSDASFALARGTASPGVPDEPLLGYPTPREQLDQVLAIAELSDHPDERVAALEAGLLLLDELAPGMPAGEVAALRRDTRAAIAREEDVNRLYADLSRRVLAAAAEAAEAARIADVEALLASLPVEDAALGGRRPRMIRALELDLRRTLEVARRQRLVDDQWQMRRGAGEQYQRMAGDMIQNLDGMRASLDAIRRFDGPAPEVLVELRRQLRGGTERLGRMQPPTEALTIHARFSAAWEAADRAASLRFSAVVSGDVAMADEASRTASDALLDLSRAQDELRALLERPRAE